MISYTFTEPRIVEDKSQPTSSALWWVSVNGWILAYCETKAEAEAVSNALKNLPKVSP